MQRFIRICALVAVALVALSLCLLLITTPFQRLLVPAIGDIKRALPIIPWVPIIGCLLQLGCMVPLALTGSKKGGIVLEIILFLCMVVALPAITSVLSAAQSALLNIYKGDMYGAANSYVSILVNYCCVFAGYGRALFCAVCGMRIVSKRLQRQIAE